jgi:hypothetical protein
VTEGLSLGQLSGSRGTRVSLRVGEMCLQCLLLFNADQQKAVIAFWVTASCTCTSSGVGRQGVALPQT